LRHQKPQFPVEMNMAKEFLDKRWKEQLRTVSGACKECGTRIEHYNVDDAGFWTDGAGRGSSKRFANCLCGGTDDIYLLIFDMDYHITKIMAQTEIVICKTCGVGMNIWGQITELGKDRFQNEEFFVDSIGNVVKLSNIWFMCQSCINRHKIHMGQSLDSLMDIADDNVNR
jgi:hypothetical protein